MSEEGTEHAIRQTLAREGIDEQVPAAGQFNARGHTGAMLVGGLAGSELGPPGSVGEEVGEVAGTLGGMRANAASHGMPQWMLVGVTDSAVYGFEGRSRRKEPESGSRIELEGNRVGSPTRRT
jgi:hypothetical protein